ncbi:MAG: hypothetical protein AAF357_03670, partial [Verrucomicrobiota bacterium]
MNNHKSACVILILLTIGMGYGVHVLYKKSSEAGRIAEEKQSEAETEESKAQLAQIQLKTLDAKTSDLRRVYAEWKPHFDRFTDAQAAEQRIAELVRAGDVFLISQKFESRDIDRDALISKALVADLVIEDDYAKALNWLGTIEESIPNCRITRCTLKRGERGNDIHLE